MKSLIIDSQEIHHQQPSTNRLNKNTKMLKIQMLEQIMNNDDNNDIEETVISPQISQEDIHQYQQQQQQQQDQNGLFIKKVSPLNG